MPIVGQFGSLAGLGSLILPGGAMESIATITVGSGGASSITFSDIPGGFQHLQVRLMLRSTDSGYAADGVRMRLNGDTGANYSWHEVAGQANGVYASSGVSQTSVNLGQSSMPSVGSNAASNFGRYIVDMLDYASTTKHKTIRTLCGNDRNDEGRIVLSSGRFGSLNAVASITFFPEYTTTFAQFSSAALYGIKAP